MRTPTGKRASRASSPIRRSRWRPRPKRSSPVCPAERSAEGAARLARSEEAARSGKKGPAASFHGPARAGTATMDESGAENQQSRKMSEATMISAKDVKKLRDMTGAGMMDCKKALEETGGDIEKAVDLMRAKGAAKAAKRAGKSANEGVIGSYVHFDNRTAVIVEVNCETDFVANTDDFKGLARDLAMHIASASPLSISPDDIPQDVVDRERAVYVEQVKEEGKPEHIADKIVEGKLQKFFKENTLLAQPFVKDPDKTIQDLITEISSRTGEKIEVARFSRMKVGEQG
jgi:elongation factor Ts